MNKTHHFVLNHWEHSLNHNKFLGLLFENKLIEISYSESQIADTTFITIQSVTCSYNNGEGQKEADLMPVLDMMGYSVEMDMKYLCSQHYRSLHKEAKVWAH